MTFLCQPDFTSKNATEWCRPTLSLPLDIRNITSQTKG